jgi:hypothetical protein
MCRDVELARGEERWYRERLGEIFIMEKQK